MMTLFFSRKYFSIPLENIQVERLLKRHFLWVMFLCCNFCVFAQKDTSQLGGSRDGCFAIEKVNELYKIKVDNVVYADNDQVFICAKTTYSIEISYADDEDLVNGTNWDWSDCNCLPASPLGPKAEINISKNKSMKVSFIENNPALATYGQKVELKLNFKLIKNIKIDEEMTHMKAAYGFDENDIEEYPSYQSGKPWKFLSKSNADLIVLDEVNKKVRHAKLNTLPTDDLAYSFDDIELNLSYDGILDRAHLHSHICDLDTLFKTDVYTDKIINIEIYRLAERDDDFENYCVDKDSTDAPRSGDHDYDGSLAADCKTKIKDLENPDKFECIDRGWDLTLDYYTTILDPLDDFWSNKDNDPSKPIDRHLVSGGAPYIHEVRVFPSKTEGDYFCNERVLTDPALWNYDTDNDGVLDAFVDRWPGEIVIDSFQNSLDAIYNQLGVYFDISYISNVTGNYDNANWGGFGEDYQNFYYFHKDQFGMSGGEAISALTTTIWVVDSLHKASGFAIYEGTDNGEVPLNTLVVSESQLKDWTVPHEVGHAKFHLYHPDGSDCVNAEIGWQIDNLKNPVKNDKYNFMNSGCLQNNFKTKLEDFKIRRHQWLLIKEK